MSIIYFGIPLKFLHTPVPNTDAIDQIKQAGKEITGAFTGKTAKTDERGYMGLNKSPDIEKGKERDHFQDTISVHMLHLLNCEIVPKSTYNVFGQAENTSAFQSKPSIEIIYDRSYTQDISEWFEMHISEMHNNYFDSMPDVPSGEKENTGWSLKKMLKSIGTAAANAVLGSSELLSSAPGLNKRRKYLRERTLYGGSNALSKLNGMLEGAVNNITGSLVDYISLGNIYDDSWLSNLKGAANASSPNEMMGGLIKSGLSAATNNINSSALNTFINGGASSFTNSLSSKLGTALTSDPGSTKEMFKNWFRNVDKAGSPIDIWPDGPTDASYGINSLNSNKPSLITAEELRPSRPPHRHYPLIEQRRNIYKPNRWNWDNTYLEFEESNEPKSLIAVQPNIFTDHSKGGSLSDVDNGPGNEPDDDRPKHGNTYNIFFDSTMSNEI